MPVPKSLLLLCAKLSLIRFVCAAHLVRAVGDSVSSFRLLRKK
ncbi:uncharacterized protein FPRO_08254 [Fusarium proliferatum ET1]|uniref:Uncharacterized protein n=1 Tax=Fusarium proliferatum (strain ET1) TaxID=1227346 RepID=A0A1L7W2J8_FUSPR|nr:uncharacterized protein FPRO_08254 [Fusarium proliferatum ET1]CVL02454.1 uncharacterized protein FPRN_07993 [Fusarium proliferatum]CZR46880.1 uncharacterized protein FPRO_08254 [Fusarium proliferatum ET1]